MTPVRRGVIAVMFALRASDASPNSRKEERMQLNIYALAKIAIMTDKSTCRS
jgi:hypothetical protein